MSGYAQVNTSSYFGIGVHAAYTPLYYKDHLGDFRFSIPQFNPGGSFRVGYIHNKAVFEAAFNVLITSGLDKTDQVILKFDELQIGLMVGGKFEKRKRLQVLGGMYLSWTNDKYLSKNRVPLDRTERMGYIDFGASSNFGLRGKMYYQVFDDFHGFNLIPYAEVMIGLLNIGDRILDVKPTVYNYSAAVGVQLRYTVQEVWNSKF